MKKKLKLFILLFLVSLPLEKQCIMAGWKGYESLPQLPTCRAIPLSSSIDSDLLEKINFEIDEFCTYYSITRSPAVINVLVVGRRNCRFSSIQAAVDCARDGDYILIRNGVYREMVTTEGQRGGRRTPRWFRRVHLVGQSAPGVVIRPALSNTGTALTLGNNSSARNLTVSGAKTGIAIDGGGASLFNVMASDNEAGITLFDKFSETAGAKAEITCCTLCDNSLCGLHTGSGATDALVRIRYCKVYRNGVGLDIGGGRCTISHSLFFRNDRGRFKASLRLCETASPKETVLRGCSFLFEKLAIDADSGERLLLRHNLFRYVRNAISLSNPLGDCVISGNSFLDIAGRGIAGRAHRLTVESNLFVRVRHALSVGGTRCTLTNNTFDTCRTSIDLNLYFEDIFEVFNNIVSNSDTGILLHKRKGRGGRVTHNTFFRVSRPLVNIDKDDSNTNRNPCFRNPAADDFRLRPASPEYDDGRSVLQSIPFDAASGRRIKGTTIDRGAFEL